MVLTIDHVASTIESTVLNFRDEAELQRNLSGFLDSVLIPHRREVTLDARNRVDFMLDNGIVIETKVSGATTDLLRQLLRYASCPGVTGIVVVSTVGFHRGIPTAIHGIPTRVVYLSNLTNRPAATAANAGVVHHHDDGTVTYGDVYLHGHQVTMVAAAHVVVKMRRLFPRSVVLRSGQFRVGLTEETATDLLWVFDRWPMRYHDNVRAELDRLAAQRQLRIETAAQVVAGHPIDATEMRVTARPARWPHQATNADLITVAKRLLVTDSLGAGKSWTGASTFRNVDALPAVVVCPNHIQTQWQHEIAASWPELTSYTVTKGSPYDPTTKRGVDRHPDVLIVPYSKLAGWEEALGGVRSIVFDEIHDLRNGATTAKGGAASRLAQQATYVVGLSVGPDSFVEMTGGPFGHGWVGTIEAATSIVAKAVDAEWSDHYEMFRVDDLGVRSRGWEGNGFGWKPVKTFVRHRCDSTTTAVDAPSGRLVLTDEHSVYRVGEDGLGLVRADGLMRGDRLAGDNGRHWETGHEAPFDFCALAAEMPSGQVVVDLAGITRHDIGVSAWQWQNFCREGKYGTRLPAARYLQHAALLPPPTGVYISNGRGGRRVDPQVHLSAWAYLLGFYLGDGWFEDGSRVGLAVETAMADHIMAVVADLPYIDLTPRLSKRAEKGSVEVRFGHPLFAEMIRRVTNGANCYDKAIPGDWIVTWPEAARRRLLQGLIDSDGAVSKRHGRRYYTTVSHALATSLLSLLRSLGVQGGLSTRGPSTSVLSGGRVIMGSSSYVVHWSRHAESGDNTGWRGGRTRHAWTRGTVNEAPVREVAPTPPPDVVYDLEMDGHPSFVANGILVHNTATPVFNYGGDVHNVMEVVAPGVLGTRHEFLREWCGQDSDNNKPKVGEPEALAAYLRSEGVMVGTVVDGPEPLLIEHAVDSDTKVFDDAVGDAATLARFILSDQTTTADRWRASGEFDMRIRQATGIAKAPYVAAFVDLLLESVDKVLLFGWHRAVYDVWMERLAKHKPVLYTGSETAQRKLAAKHEFVNGDARVLVMSLRSGQGVDGLQQVCHTTVFGELDWSPAQHDQAVGRLNRPGQEHQVLAYFLTSDTGADPTMINVLGVKDRQAAPFSGKQAAPFASADVGNRVREMAERFLAR